MVPSRKSHGHESQVGGFMETDSSAQKEGSETACTPSPGTALPPERGSQVPQRGPRGPRATLDLSLCRGHPEVLGGPLAAAGTPGPGTPRLPAPI